jgi:cytochrome b561
MKQVTRYHPLLVALHWLLAFLIIASLFAGFFLLEQMPNSDPQKIRVLLVHMVIGMGILALMVVRFVIRMLTSHPEPATTGYAFLDRLAPVTHYGFYVLVVLMVATGYATAILAGLNRIVFQHSGEPLPESFEAYPTFIAHGFIAFVLAGFVVLHVLAALYHQFVRRDRLFRRIWFGRRAPRPAAPAQ